MKCSPLVALLFLVPLPCLGQEASAAAGSEAERPAYVLSEGSLVRNQVVAMARDLVIDGECRAGAAALGGSARISGSIAGDLVVVGGDVELSVGAEVAGDVFVFGGQINNLGATVGGRSVAYPTAPSTWLLLLEGPALGRSALAPDVIATKLAVMSAWLVTCLLLVTTARRGTLDTAEVVRQESLRCLLTGVVAVMAAVMTIVFFTSFAGAGVGVPMVALVVLAGVLAKLWGTVAIFVAVGRFLLERSGRLDELPLTMAMVGIILFGVVKLVPYLGVWVWTLVTLIAVGASLQSKFGRLEPWFGGSEG